MKLSINNTPINTDLTDTRIIFEQTQRLVHEQAVLEERTIRYVFKPAPRFIPDKLWFKLIAKLIVREEHRK